jgi:type II secretory pathway pseudopilin PulG
VAGASDRSNTPVVVVVVAVVGLLATVGSAALGGYWANRSVERQLESQRSAEIQDQRREVYRDYLRAVGNACQALTVLDSAGAEGEANKAAIEADKALFEVLTQGGRVRLIAGLDLEHVVRDGTSALVFEPATGPCSSNPKLRQYVDAFIDAAQPDLKGSKL